MTTIPELSEEQLAKLQPQELAQHYLAKQVDFGRATQELQRRRQQRRLHVPAEQAPVAEAGPHQRMIIGPELGFDIYNFHVFTSGRAGGSERYHSHGDAVKYYVAGRGFEVVGEQRFEVKVGDFMHVPGNIWHGTENPYDEPLVFLAAQQFVGTFRQVPTPFVHKQGPHQAPKVKDLSPEELAKLEPWPLYLVYLEKQMEFGRVALEMQRRRQQKRLRVSAEEAPLLEWGPGRHMIIAPELGFDVYSFNVFLEHVPPKSTGGASRIAGDTVKYYLTGGGAEVVGEQRLNVKAGDFLHVPANTWHETRNPNGEPLRFLCWQQIPGTFLQVPSPLLSRG
jgi:mannose-6-phosphate isomerase-like protein (cupin superfamily)